MMTQDKINDLENQIKKIKEDLQKVYQSCAYGQNALHPVINYIPYEQSWEEESMTSIKLPKEDGEIKVTASSVWHNHPHCKIQWIFNGKPEIPGELCWATNENEKNNFLIVNFRNIDKPVNLITILSRTSSPDQAPVDFEIYGSDDIFNYENQLGVFRNVSWRPTEEKRFSFHNEINYPNYKIVFNKSSADNNVIGFSGFNLGRLDLI